MKTKQQNKGEIIIYQTSKKEVDIKVRLEKETVWLDARQMAQIFDVNRPAIVKHINNIYKSKELNENSTCSILEQVAAEGKKRKINFYNLDMIISVGYRVNSKRATQFRVWATSVLKEYLIKGYAFNQKRIKQLQNGQLKKFEQAVGLIKKTIETKQLTARETDGLLKVITDYASSWLLLQKYDEEKLEIKKTSKTKYQLDYKDAKTAIGELKSSLIEKKEATGIFGEERNNSFQGIAGNIYQTFGGKELYPSIEEKAAHLLYFIIKDHPFIDGNKRVGSFLFIVFLARNKFLFKKNGERKINDNALVALALLIAESKPSQKDVLIKLVINFLAK